MKPKKKFNVITIDDNQAVKHPMQCAKCFRVCRLSDSGKTWVCTICKHREKANGGKAVSDTPRTDAHNWNEGHYDDPLHSLLDFAKQLERELNAANDRIKRLEEAGNELIWAFCPASVSMMTERESDALKLWNKAKEDKL